MQRAKEERKTARRLFSMSATKLEVLLPEEDKILIAAEFTKLTDRHKKLQEIQNRVISLWLDDSERDPQAFDSDVNASEEYEDKWYVLEQKVREFNKSLETRDSTKKILSTLMTLHILKPQPSSPTAKTGVAQI